MSLLDPKNLWLSNNFLNNNRFLLLTLVPCLAMLLSYFLYLAYGTKLMTQFPLQSKYLTIYLTLSLFILLFHFCYCFEFLGLETRYIVPQNWMSFQFSIFYFFQAGVVVAIVTFFLKFRYQNKKLI